MSESARPRLKFTRCGVTCRGLCVNEGETCDGLLADESRPYPDVFETWAGVVRIADSEPVLMNSAGQIYSGSKDRSEVFGNYPEGFEVAIWQAHWHGYVTVQGQGADLASLVVPTDNGRQLVATVDNRS